MGQTVEILVAHGVNLDLLGQREPGTYGSQTLDDLNKEIESKAAALAKLVGIPSVKLTFYQSNEEAKFLEKLDAGWDGVLINPAAWTHTSIALADRLKAHNLMYVEVHLSNISNREEFRKHSYSAAGAAGVVYGFGAQSYLSGLYGLLAKISQAGN